MEKPRTKETQKDSGGRTLPKQLLQWYPAFCAGLQIELEEKYQAGESKGRREGRREGRQEGRSELSRLILKLSELGRTDDIVKVAENLSIRSSL